MGDNGAHMSLLYTAKQTSKIYREHHIYRVMSETDEYLQVHYGLPCRTSLANPKEKMCSLCHALLCDMANGEHWLMDEDWRLWCARCLPQRPRVTPLAPIYSARLPLLLCNIVKSVQQHPDFLKLNKTTRERVQAVEKMLVNPLRESNKTCGGSQTATKEMTQLWKFIYWGHAPAEQV
jgi:hypothetical protein